MIIKEATGYGKTVEEAREDAEKQLGAGINDDVQFEVLATPKKKVLGLFGGNDAKVRIYIEVPDAPVKKEKKDGSKNNKTKAENKTAKRPVKPEKKVERENNDVAKTEVAGVPASEIDATSGIGKAYGYLVGVLEKLGCTETDAIISEVEGGSKITFKESDKLGVVIGRRGETLDALQYLASLVANENNSGYYRVVIDIGNYREKREKTLENLAKRTAGQVLRTRRSRSLEPMNPYERRVIHTAVQNIDGVVSSSVGVGQNRRVVISLEGKAIDAGERNSASRQRQGLRESSQESCKPEAQQVEKPKQTDGTKLYGKLK